MYHRKGTAYVLASFTCDTFICCSKRYPSAKNINKIFLPLQTRKVCFSGSKRVLAIYLPRILNWNLSFGLCQFCLSFVLKNVYLLYIHSEHPTPTSCIPWASHVEGMQIVNPRRGKENCPEVPAVCSGDQVVLETDRERECFETSEKNLLPARRNLLSFPEWRE